MLQYRQHYVLKIRKYEMSNLASFVSLAAMLESESKGQTFFYNGEFDPGSG
jgi:hypothetical protein